MIERLSKIKFENLILKEASPKEGIASLFDRMNQLNKTKGNIIQAFDYDSVINKTHLFAAYINALMAFGSHSNKAKSASMEMLLFAAMTDQIGTAIETVGARGNSRILIFANSEKGFDGIRDLLKEIKEFKPDAQHTAQALKKFGIKNTRSMDRSILQKMAMSRLKL
jgi:tRNA threonylcarbamoyladenosine modification (KEOPS) complex Cgi121 subunit